MCRIKSTYRSTRVTDIWSVRMQQCFIFISFASYSHTMIATEDLKYTYTSQSSELLSFPNVQCAGGEHWLLLGKSGSGKTTLLHLLAGLRTPQEGSVIVNGTALEQLSGSDLDQFRGKYIGVIFQQSHFVRSLSVLDNLLLTQSLAGLDPDKTVVSDILSSLNMQHKLNAMTSALSVGEQQRVAIARALINRPSVILADEPTSALDDENTEQVVDLLKAQAALANATLLIVTHDNRLKSVFENRIQL